MAVVLSDASTCPTANLRHLLAEQRRGERAFEEAWLESVPLALNGTAGDDRKGWQAALADTKVAWRLAYCRQGHQPLSGLFVPGASIEATPAVQVTTDHPHH
jgi:hypothetical protein